MYCRKCGAEIADNIRYCNRCGAPTTPEERIAPHIPQSAEKSGKEQKNTIERSPLIWGIFGVGVCLILGICFIGSAEDDDEWGDEIGSAIYNAADYQNPTTRDYALSLVRSDHSGEFNIAQICDVWEQVYRKWTYVNDPQGTDYLSPASRTISISLKGDCDDFAVLVAALIEAIGGNARVVLASDSSSDGHAFPEVYVGDDYKDLRAAAYYICERYGCKTIWYQKTEGYFGTDEYWINLDWWNDHPGGDFFPFEYALTVDMESGETTMISDDEEVGSIMYPA